MLKWILITRSDSFCMNPLLEILLVDITETRSTILFKVQA
jgi:hypothetical protein